MVLALEVSLDWHGLAQWADDCLLSPLVAGDTHEVWKISVLRRHYIL